MSSKKVALVVIRRLPRYYRYLSELLLNGVDRISSKDLSERMGVTASQIRQDLNCFGGFGQQGYGYNVEYLYREIGKLLGLENGRTMIIIGAGNLGHAIAGYSNFERRGFRLIGIFDSNKGLVGDKVKGVGIMHSDDLESFIAVNKPDIAVLAIPKVSAQDMLKRLTATGIKGIWNFSMSELKVPDGMAIETVHLSDSLMTLSCKMMQTEME